MKHLLRCFKQYSNSNLVPMLRLTCGLCWALAAVFLILEIDWRADNNGEVIRFAVALLLLAGAMALGLTPFFEVRAKVTRARMLVEMGRFREALLLLNRTPERAPNMVNRYIVRSAAHAGLGQIDQATEDAERAVRIAPGSTDARLARARLFSHRGLHEDAIRDLQAGISHKPDWAAGYLELAQVHFRLQDYERGLAALQDLSQRTSSEGTRYDSMILAGWIHEEKLKDLDGAIAIYTRAIPLLPDRKIGYLRRAYAFRQRGDYFQAAEDLLRAAQRLPTQEDAGQYHWLRAVCYGRRFTITGDRRDFVAWLAALEDSTKEDAPEYREQAQMWLKSLRNMEVAEPEFPPLPRLYPN